MRLAHTRSPTSRKTLRRTTEKVEPRECIDGAINLLNGPARRKVSFGEGFVSSRGAISRFMGASTAWFVMDFAYYGNTTGALLHAR